MSNTINNTAIDKEIKNILINCIVTPHLSNPNKSIDKKLNISKAIETIIPKI